MTPTTPTTPKEQALHLLAEYSAAQSTLNAATAPFEAQKAAIDAALTKATAAEKSRIEALEAELRVLALAHGPEIFGAGHSSLIANGYRLLVTESEATELLQDEDAICRRIYADLRAMEGSEDKLSRLALASVLNMKLSINKAYVLANYATAPEWFLHYGVTIADKENATVKPAPKPKATKAATNKSTPPPES